MWSITNSFYGKINKVLSIDIWRVWISNKKIKRLKFQDVTGFSRLIYAIDLLAQNFSFDFYKFDVENNDRRKFLVAKFLIFKSIFNLKFPNVGKLKMRFERKKIDFIYEINYQQKNNYLPSDIYI